MFTVAQIEAARNKSKTGADFPRYVQEIKALGLIRYEFMVEDGRTLFYGGDDQKMEGKPAWSKRIINPVPLTEQMARHLREHQAGKSDFPTFCAQAAATGVHHWEVNTVAMRCTYFDLSGKKMIGEPIPQA